MDLLFFIQTRILAIPSFESCTCTVRDVSAAHYGHSGYQAGKITHIRVTIQGLIPLSTFERHQRVHEAIKTAYEQVHSIEVLFKG